MLNISMTNFPNGISSFGIPVLPGPTVYGNVWFVNTGATAGGYGQSPSQPFTTMAQALSAVGDNDVIAFIGTVREQLVAPLGVTGVSIVGCAGGGVRDDDGAKWTYPTSGAVAGQALLELREQGWSVSNFLMTPEPTSGAAVKLHRAEDATYPDASHFKSIGMRYVGIDVTTTYGIQDVGGCSNVFIQDSEFYLLTTGIYTSSTAIALPLRWRVLGNRFLQNTNDFISPQSYGILEGNRFMSSAATTKISTDGGGHNIITGNVFPNNAADIDPAGGYTGTATDIWTGNLVGNQAAFMFGQPA